MISAERIEQLKGLGYRVDHFTSVSGFACDIWQGHSPGGDFQDHEPGYSEAESWEWCDKHAKVLGH